MAQIHNGVFARKETAFRKESGNKMPEGSRKIAREMVFAYYVDAEKCIIILF